jgi:xanthine dehydrogenase accessory factor
VRPEILRLAAQLAERGERFAIATVVARRAPSSARVGDTALVTASGGFHGFVGGSCVKPTVLEQAQKALAEGRPRRIVLSPDPNDPHRGDAAVFPMTCHSGGSVEIHIQPVLLAPRLLVYGLSPTGRALVRLGAAMGYRVTAVDPGADATSAPDAEATITEVSAVPAAKPEAGDLFAVVATHGEWDEEAALGALALRPAYLGIVTSARRAEELREFLEKKLAAEDRPRLAALRAPAGLRIGAVEGEEIALSILAEIVSARRAAPPAKPRVSLPLVAAEQAIDPVCGMTVVVAGARHTAEHQGRPYYFCCAGCREKFLAEVERYLSGERKA